MEDKFVLKLEELKVVATLSNGEVYHGSTVTYPKPLTWKELEKCRTKKKRKVS